MQTGKPLPRLNWAQQLLGLWLVVAAVLIAFRWQNIDYLILADTDDNLRLAQVKAWLAGQGWYDLRQYKLDPPGGANIHWSRLPDLPLGGIMAGLSPFLGRLMAEKIAIGVAPLFPLGVAMLGVTLVARRLLGGAAWLFAVALLCSGAAALGMFLPVRIDHHGWQLAFLALALAGLADPEARRGGLTVGLATAASLSVGLEMLPYLALCGGLVGLRWLMDVDQAARLRAYGLALALGTALGFAVFASQANRAPRCDALTPVWLSTLVLAGALLVVLPALSARRLPMRIAAAVLSALLVAVFFAGAWPQCLGRPEGLSDALYRDWFMQISEVRPLYKLDANAAISIAALPVLGLLGSLVMIWRDRAQWRVWGQFAVLGAAALAMLFWQMRAGPAAQILSIPGATALMMQLVPGLARSRVYAVRAFGPIAAFILLSGIVVPISGAVAPLVMPAKPASSPSVTARARQASARCTTLAALRPIARVQPGTMFTFVDLSPRLIAMTPHKAIAGPYHRNGAAILDVFSAFRGDPDRAQRIIRAHHAGYVLICPGMAEGNNHLKAGPKGFLAQLQKGQTPDWLEPMPLPADSPFRLWRVRPAQR
ncbi:MAG: AcrB/AcrD/AcrF family protein [Chakrabartia sp.]